MSHLETSNADSAQTKDDWNENLEFWGVQLIVYFQLIVYKTQMSHSETSNAHSAQSKDDWNENLEFLMSSADCLLSADCLQNPNEPFRDF